MTFEGADGLESVFSLVEVSLERLMAKNIIVMMTTRTPTPINRSFLALGLTNCDALAGLGVTPGGGATSTGLTGGGGGAMETGPGSGN